MEKIIDIEEQMNANVDLLQVARDYCEYNIENSRATSSLIPLLEIMLQKQRSIVADFDELMLN